MPDPSPDPHPADELSQRGNDRPRSAPSGWSGGMEPSIAGMDVLTMRIDANGVILHVNSAFATHCGVPSRQDIIGKKTDILRRFLNQEMLLSITNPEREGESVVRTATDKIGRVFEVKTTLHDGLLDVVMQDVTEEHQFRGLVQRYVLKDFDNLTEEELRTFRFPERRFMTVGFTDLRGFTALTETLRPEEVRGMINAYFEETIKVVEDNGATVAQLVGDEVMALYGAPRYYKDHALRAIKSACEQVEKVEELRERYAGEGKNMCPCGVGLNTGDLVLGNMGGASKQTYTVLGSAVNLASRLCSAAKPTQILLTEVVLRAALEALPDGWEIVETRSLMGGEEDLSGVGGKIEGVHELPDNLRGKVISIGYGIKSQKKPAEFSFRYLYLLKAKGVAQELPVISVERSRRGRGRVLSDETVPGHQAEIMVGKYRLLEVIGQGGMGRVWLARDQFGNRVAIKMLTAGEGASPHQVLRFKREAEIMAQLSHHHICRIYEIGEAEGVIYIAMEYVDGVSLGDILRRGREHSHGPESKGSAASELPVLVASIKSEKKASSASHAGENQTRALTGQNSVTAAADRPNSRPGSSSSTAMVLPLQQSLSIILKAGEAVQYAHEHGVLHRDIKPDNIVLRSDGDPVVMDFGLAKLEKEARQAGASGSVSLSMDGQIVGTIEYMAPEQAVSSKHVTERADVYSLGAILYELLTGRKHFVSTGNILDDGQRLLEHEPVPPRKYSRQIESDLETIVMKALHPDQRQRYASVKHFLEDLRRYQAGDAIWAHGPSLFYRLSKQVRKHRVAFSFMALFMVVLLFASYSVIQWRMQWGDWEEELGMDFGKGPSQGQKVDDWLRGNLDFESRDLTAAAKPWPVKNGELQMRKTEWCWLKNIRIPNFVRVVMKVRIDGDLDAFQVCVNSRRQIKYWESNPPGYSFRLGIWRGAADIIMQNSTPAPNEFNQLLVSALSKVAIPSPDGRPPTATREFTLTFEHLGDRLIVSLNGKEVHRDLCLTPLTRSRGHEITTERFDQIGVRTWSSQAKILSIHAYRYKLGERTLPTVTGDALAEEAHYAEALGKYREIAKDYENVSPSIAAKALTKAYLMAIILIGEDGEKRDDYIKLRKELYRQITGLKSNALHDLLGKGLNPEYVQSVREEEAIQLWTQGERDAALESIAKIFEQYPDTRVAVNCLIRQQQDVSVATNGGETPVESRLDPRLMSWIAKTRNLASLDLRNLGLKDIRSVSGLTSMVAFDCRDNRGITDLVPLRGMTGLRALYIRRNQISSLEPLKGCGLLQLSAESNHIKNLEPLRAMSTLMWLDCRNNGVKDLTPIGNCPLYWFNCSNNPIPPGRAEDPWRNHIKDLTPVEGMGESLQELYCGWNNITSLEPLQHLTYLGVLDCNNNQIEKLTPLQGLGQLYNLNCSGNLLTSLEPFVTGQDPPKTFLFDCKTLTNEELDRAISKWTEKRNKLPKDEIRPNDRFNIPILYAQYVKILRQGDPKQLRSLGVEFKGHHYLFVEEPMSEKKALAFTEEVGGHLVTLTDKETVEETNQFLKTIVPPEAACRTGLKMENHKPTWVTKKPVDFSPESGDWGAFDGYYQWKNGSWLPPASASASLDRSVPLIVEWDQ